MSRYRLEYLTQWGWMPVCDAMEGTRAYVHTELRARKAENGTRTYRAVSVPFPAADRAGIAYWDHEVTARNAAARIGWPTGRIIPYGRGWAVQRNPSGEYLTRDEWMKHTAH